MSESTENPSARLFKFQYGIRTDVGKKRTENQDSHGHAHTHLSSVFLVADGMGGAKGGATASAIAVDHVLKSVFTEGGGLSEKSISQALTDTNALIYEKSQLSDDLHGMGTTAALLGIAGDELLVGHVGDSRSYMLRDEKLSRLTRDHTLVQELVESGAIGPAEAENHPIAHMLTRSLGPAVAVDAEVKIYEEKLRPGDTFLICCDGLYNLVPDDEIEGILKAHSPEQAADKFVELVLERGAPDNVTVIVFRTHLTDDSTVEFLVPEKGKLRLVLSREVPEMPSAERINVSSREATSAPTMELPVVPPEGETKDEEKKAEEPKKKRNPLEDVITTSDVQKINEEKARRKEEKKAAKEKQATVGEEPSSVEIEELKNLEEAEALRRLTMIGAAIILVAVLVLSYFFLVRTDTRSRIIPIAKNTATPTAKPTEVPTTVVTEQPTPIIETTSSGPTEALIPNTLPPGASRVDALLGQEPSSSVNEGSSLPSQVYPPLTTLKDVAATLSVEENAALEPIVNLIAPEEPKLKKDYLADNSVQPIDWNKEKTPTAVPQKLLSSSEKLEISQKKTELRGILVENDIKLLALDSSGDSELNSRSSFVEKKTKLLEGALLKVDDVLRTAYEEKKAWQRRLEQLSNSDPVRIAADVAQNSPQVAEQKAELDKLQEDYRQTLALWNQDRQNPELVSKTAALSRQIKVSKTKLEVSIKSAVDATIQQTNTVVMDSKFTKFQLEKVLERLQRQVGFLKAAQPNAGGRNETRLKSLLQERRESAEQLKQLTAVFSDQDEKKFIQEKFKGEN